MQVQHVHPVLLPPEICNPSRTLLNTKTSKIYDTPTAVIQMNMVF